MTKILDFQFLDYCVLPVFSTMKTLVISALDSEGLQKKTYLCYFIMGPQKCLFTVYCLEIS